MPKLTTMLQVRREMGITFVPYARFRVQTRHSPEECAAHLRAVTQPQKLPKLFSARTSPDRHLLFKGTVTRTGFFAVPVDNTGIRKYQGLQPFWVSGKFQPAFGGTDIMVQVLPSLLALVTGCLLLLMMLYATFFLVEQIWAADLAARIQAIVYLPVSLVTSIFLWAAVALPVSFQAYKIKNALRQLLSEPLSAARAGGELLF